MSSFSRQERHGSSVRFEFLPAHLAQSFSRPCRDTESGQIGRFGKSLLFQVVDPQLKQVGFSLPGFSGRPAASFGFHAYMYDKKIQKNQEKSIDV
jgi:hypothetical protein